MEFRKNKQFIISNLYYVLGIILLVVLGVMATVSMENFSSQLSVIAEQQKKMQQMSRFEHMEEMLTYSAHNFIDTQDSTWWFQYKNIDSLFRSTFKALDSSSEPETVSEAFKLYDSVTARTYILEQKAFEMMNCGKLDSARVILNSSEYVSMKESFHKQIEGIYSDQTSGIEKLRQEFIRMFINSKRVDYAFFLLALVLLVVAGYVSFRKRQNIEENKELAMHVSQAIAELRASEEKFRDFIHSVTDLYFALDKELNYIFWNKACERLLGLGSKDVVGKSWYSFAFNKGFEWIADKYKQAILKKQPDRFEVRFDAGDHRIYFFANIYPTSSGLVVYLQDITDLKLTEQKLLDEKVFTDRVLNAQSDTFFLYEPLTGKAIKWNRSFSEITGYNDHEIAEKLVPGSYCSKEDLVRAKVFNRMLPERKVGTIEMDLICKDGRRVPTEYRVSILENENEAPCYIAIGRDISVRRKDEAFKTAQLEFISSANKHTVNELLIKALDELELLTDSKVGFYHFMESDQETLSLQAWSTNTKKNMCSSEGEGLHYSVSKAGVWTDCIAVRKPVIHNNYDALPHKKGLPEGHAPILRELVVPVIRNDMIVAILGVGNKPDDYTNSDAELVLQFAELTWETIERRRAQDNLKLSQERYKLLSDLSKEGIAVHQGGVIEDLNDRFSEIFGYQREELLGINPIDILFEKTFTNEIKERISNRTSTSYHARGIKKDGSLIWVEVEGMNLTLTNDNTRVAVVRDITQSKIREELLRENQERIKILSDLAMEGILIHKNGIAQDVNPALEKLVGIERQELLGKNMIEQFGTNLSKQIIIDNIKKDFAGPYEVDIKNKEGRIIPVEITSYFLSKEKNLRVAAIRDISAQREMERRILNAIIEAEEKERNRFSQELHDGLGPVLSSLNMYFEWLSNTRDTEEKKLILENGTKNIHEAINLVEEISNNLTPRILNTFGLNDALETFISRLKIKDQIKFSVNSNFKKRLTQHYEAAIYRVITELINNTIKYAGATEIDIEIVHLTKKRKLFIRYSDNGKGFDYDKKMEDQSGLGLINMNERIKTLGGAIFFNTAPGRGLAVEIVLQEIVTFPRKKYIK